MIAHAADSTDLRKHELALNSFGIHLHRASSRFTFVALCNNHKSMDTVVDVHLYLEPLTSRASFGTGCFKSTFSIEINIA